VSHSLRSGYWFLEQPDDSTDKKWSPPDSLVRFLERAKTKGKKVVYIGFGRCAAF
jgi:hypothetical protein